MYIFYSIGMESTWSRIECQSLCSSEVTQKMKQLEVEGCPIAGDANALIAFAVNKVHSQAAAIDVVLVFTYLQV